jgi:hypothetical protein
MPPSRVKAFEESLLRFLKEEGGSANLNIEGWKFGDDRMKSIAEGYGKAADASQDVADKFRRTPNNLCKLCKLGTPSLPGEYGRIVSGC